MSHILCDADIAHAWYPRCLGAQSKRFIKTPGRQTLSLKLLQLLEKGRGERGVVGVQGKVQDGV